MKMKLKDYISNIEDELKEKRISSTLTSEILTQISFFQHERLVHLIVTFFTGISAILFLLGFLFLENIALFLLFLVTLLLFIPYIFHYYYLENGVQKLYDLYWSAKEK